LSVRPQNRLPHRLETSEAIVAIIETNLL